MYSTVHAGYRVTEQRNNIIRGKRGEGGLISPLFQSSHSSIRYHSAEMGSSEHIPQGQYMEPLFASPHCKTSHVQRLFDVVRPAPNGVSPCFHSRPLRGDRRQGFIPFMGVTPVSPVDAYAYGNLAFLKRPGRVTR